MPPPPLETNPGCATERIPQRLHNQWDAAGAAYAVHAGALVRSAECNLRTCAPFEVEAYYEVRKILVSLALVLSGNHSIYTDLFYEYTRTVARSMIEYIEWTALE